MGCQGSCSSPSLRKITRNIEVENQDVPINPNIARGTTYPEIDPVTWIELGNNMVPLTIVANLATRWRHLHYLQIWPTDSAIYINCKFGLQMASLA